MPEVVDKWRSLATAAAAAAEPHICLEIPGPWGARAPSATSGNNRWDCFEPGAQQKISSQSSESSSVVELGRAAVDGVGAARRCPDAAMGCFVKSVPPSRASERLEDVEVDGHGRSCPAPPERPCWSPGICPVCTTVCGAEREGLVEEELVRVEEGVGAEVDEGQEEVVGVEVEVEGLDSPAVFDLVSSCMACFFFFFFWWRSSSSASSPSTAKMFGAMKSLRTAP